MAFAFLRYISIRLAMNGLPQFLKWQTAIPVPILLRPRRAITPLTRALQTLVAARQGRRGVVAVAAAAGRGVKTGAGAAALGRKAMAVRGRVIWVDPSTSMPLSISRGRLKLTNGVEKT